ncbi:hypothetical protein [Caldiplasma sukawensis]
MKHSKPQDLIEINELLNNIRMLVGIKEKAYGHFYFKGKGVLHFHTDFDKLYADFLDERIELGHIKAPSKEKEVELLNRMREYVLQKT